MQQPQHAILAAHDPMSPRRIISFGLVGALHFALIAAVISGLAHRYVKVIPPVLEATVIDQPTAEPKQTALAKPAMAQPEEPAIAPPDIIIDTNSQAPALPLQPQQQANPPVSAAATGVTSTHTTPPYPGQERREGIEGTVQLHLSVGADGRVSSATVVRSSGNADLDSNAVAWVVAHWKYKPALASGVPVASETDANVVYDLKKAHG